MKTFLSVLMWVFGFLSIASFMLYEILTKGFIEALAAVGVISIFAFLIVGAIRAILYASGRYE